MFLSKLGYSELVQRLFEKMTFFLVDPLPPRTWTSLNLTHYHNVFNSHHPTDPTVFEDVQQRHIIWELNDPITWDEFRQAVKKLKNEKAAGLTGVPAEAFTSHAKCRPTPHSQTCQ
jgi:hypothetical protein